MNLIERSVNPANILAFRSLQYSMLENFIKIGIRYLMKLGLTVDYSLFNINDPLTFIPDFNYNRIQNYAIKILRVKILNQKNYHFINLSIPELLNGIFFYLNCTYYVPLFYIMDEPITVKEKSIVLQSLFQPITLYFDDNRVIFMGNNFKISHFLQLISMDWPDDDKNLISVDLGIPLDERSPSELISRFAGKFNTDHTLESIKYKFNELFFDEWTYYLFKRIYNFEPNIDTIIKRAIERRLQIVHFPEFVPKFNDLRFKRLAFIEPLIRPYFKSISMAANNLVHGNPVSQLKKLDMGTIIKNFFGNLHGNVLYDTTNGYSGILGHKASFRNPYGSAKRLPKEVSAIHWTHKGRICPNSISNQDPGEIVSLVPDQEIDLTYGLFKFDESELLLPS